MKILYNQKEISDQVKNNFKNLSDFCKLNEKFFSDQQIVCVLVNGENVNSNYEFGTNDSIELISFKTKLGKEIFWHSSAHVLATAVAKICPTAQLAIGPAIDMGFYYDFDCIDITENDFEEISKVFASIVGQKLEFVAQKTTKEKALKLFENSPYKKELLSGIEDDHVTIYSSGEFRDLCRGPHIINTSLIKAFMPTKVSGAYWRGDSNNKMLKRIYGISFPNKAELDEYKNFLKEAERRDHREIAKKLDLFSFHQEAPGCVFWHNNGMILKDEVIKYWLEEHKKRNYKLINTPIILNRSLWEKSGHWDLYHENMYVTKIDEQDFVVKPMNCPGGVLVYKQSMHSYRELPLRFAELGLVHRHELSGALHGICRVRQFVQDDAHIFCMPEQLETEIKNILTFAFEMLKKFGFSDYVISISLRSKEKEAKYLGDNELWEKAESILRNVLQSLGVEFVSNEGDAKFYGPSVDILIKDCLKREWQCTTIQVDFNLPMRFELEYVNENNERKTPIMLHRTILGSLERFIGVLIEQCAGMLPTWLSPTHVMVVPIAMAHNDYADTIVDQLASKGLRVDTDYSNESLNKRIRNAELKRIPYIIVVGDKELAENKISVRGRSDKTYKGDQLEDFAKMLQNEITQKTY